MPGFEESSQIEPVGGSRGGGPGAGSSASGILGVLQALPAAAPTGCGSAPDASATPDGRSGVTTSAQALTTGMATITVTPAAGTRKAEFTSPVEVTATDGTPAPASVTVTCSDGSALSGACNDGRTKWTSAKNPCSRSASW
ncbi:hypothetical protein [Streptomyces sp. NPDC058964]|uniref:hypothetical protein n=1 Tax=Streptomyces sp. NPDC058964 TaxID=3346681 RepID=UPI003692D101